MNGASQLNVLTAVATSEVTATCKCERPGYHWLKAVHSSDELDVHIVAEHAVLPAETVGV
jgi:hypothetical protein